MTKRAAGALLLGISLDRSGHAQSLSTQLYAELRRLVLSGRLAGGQRLPASRVLAKEHGVARATVADAYERLAAEGLITAHWDREPTSPVS